VLKVKRALEVTGTAAQLEKAEKALMWRTVKRVGVDGLRYP
jgi:hypothetical protein